MIRTALFAVVLLCASGASLAAEDTKKKRLMYEGEVARVLKTKCGKCHGSDKPKAELELTSPAGLLRGGETGAAVVKGDLEKSLLWERIESDEMPPEDEKPLSDKEKLLLKRWILEGAGFASAPTARPLTQHDIVPLMLLRCAVCHGGRKKEGGLDLRTKAGILKGGKSGPAAIAGKPQESLLIKRIAAEEMPPRRRLVKASVKPMPDEELEKVKRWIAAGMPEVNTPPDVADGRPDPLVTDKDRRHWAFQTPRRPPLPSVKHPELLRNPIDTFVLSRLERRGLTFSPPAERSTLLRRVYYDLVGLPPTPEELDALLSDTRPRSFERAVERLLSSPRHGERWARRWLDVAGYADSEGSQNEDRVRPDMFRYRDYVIRAFNADKPYDRFLHEQIAGDELADYENSAEITDEMYDNLAATGFLRTAPDRTFAGITNFVPDRLEVIADEVQILGSAVMGLTVNCARCHSHKFDPIPQRDYYRLAATLKDALDEHDWLGPEQRKLTFVSSTEREAWEENNRAIDEQVKAIEQKQKEEKDEKKKKELEQQIKQLKGSQAREPKIRALWSRGDPSPTYILRRGDYLKPGHEVGPGVPSVLTDGSEEFVVKRPWPGAKQSGRRLALARWLTKPSHPLTSRVIVNRIWRHHFGHGIVETVGNFGRTGEKPTHPQLLDWLATELVSNQWSLKRLHFLMVTSATYRQSSSANEALLAADPDGRLLSRMPLRRLEAETMRDALIHVAGRLSERPFGPADAIDVRGDGLVTVKPHADGWRRSIYALQRRTKMPTILENFDSPQMSPNCLARGESIVAPQALHLLNNGTVHELARSFAERMRREASSSREAQVTRIYRTALSRRPTADELRAATEALENLEKKWREEFQKAKSDGADPQLSGLINFCHAIMNSAAFVYVD